MLQVTLISLKKISMNIVPESCVLESDCVKKYVKIGCESYHAASDARCFKLLKYSTISSGMSCLECLSDTHPPPFFCQNCVTVFWDVRTKLVAACCAYCLIRWCTCQAANEQQQLSHAALMMEMEARLRDTEQSFEQKIRYLEIAHKQETKPDTGLDEKELREKIEEVSRYVC